MKDKLEYPPKPKSSGLIIAICGPHGAGKSTYALRLAKQLQLKYVSAGQIFRQYAKEHGLSLRKLSKQVLDMPNLDLQIDQETINVALKGGVIIDASLSAWILEPYADLKILITAPLTTRVKRIASRENKTYPIALHETRTREESERRRFLDLYGVDITDWRPFDIIIDSSHNDVDKTYRIVESTAKAFLFPS
ncbi:MAG: (d)CMP kinase [Candidatus Ranarchaeia archaeon]